MASDGTIVTSVLPGTYKMLSEVLVNKTLTVAKDEEYTFVLVDTASDGSKSACINKASSPAILYLTLSLAVTGFGGFAAIYFEEASSENLLLFLDGDFLGPKTHGTLVTSKEGTLSTSTAPRSSPVHTVQLGDGTAFISLVVTFDANASKWLSSSVESCFVVTSKLTQLYKRN